MKILLLKLHDLFISTFTPSLPNEALPRLDSIISWLIALPFITAILYLMAIDWPATDNVLIGIVLSTLKLNPNFLTVVLSSSRSLTSSNSFSLFSFSKIFLNNFSLEMKLNFSAIFLTNSAVSFSSLIVFALIS